MLRLLVAGLVLSLGLAAVPGWNGPGGPYAAACPFCCVPKTLSEEIDAADVVAIAKLIKTVPGKPEGLQQIELEIVRVLKGTDRLGGQRKVREVDWLAAPLRVQVPIYNPAPPSPERDRFLLMATKPGSFVWQIPIYISAEGEEYAARLLRLPKGTERFEFFLAYLDHPDEYVAADTFDEFKRASHDDLKRLTKKLDRAKIAARLQDFTGLVGGKRRLYFELLGLAGRAEDAPPLWAMLRSPDPNQRQALDGLLGCLLVLDQQGILAHIDERYLTKGQCDLPTTYSAIVALRNAAERKTVSAARLCQSFRLMLDQPEFADLVIADLARAEDWSVLPRLVELFKNADEKTQWVRVPIINYLRACPLPEAKQRLAEFAKLDPEQYERALAQFPEIGKE